MDITYLGHSSFKIRGKDATVITDPFDPERVGIRYPKEEADIVTISHDHFDHNFISRIESPKMVIRVPGEYEVMGVSIIGISTYHDEENGKVRGKNIIFVIESDNLRIAHLGDLGHKLNEKLIDQIGDLDVLLIPVGGVYTITPKVAAEIVKDLEPSITIPMHYKTDDLNQEEFGKLAKVDEFLQELGYDVERLDKLSLKKELINEEELKVVVLERK
jgi:L-ascorbate metabolism protein UlaG (beta-lactamase superfamily)